MNFVQSDVRLGTLPHGTPLIACLDYPDLTVKVLHMTLHKRHVDIKVFGGDVLEGITNSGSYTMRLDLTAEAMEFYETVLSDRKSPYPLLVELLTPYDLVKICEIDLHIMIAC